MTAEASACSGHPGLSELRALAAGALDRLVPVLDRLRAEPATAPGVQTCVVCPVCALAAVLRGERPELAVRLAEQAAGLVAVLRAALEEGDPASVGLATDPPAPPPSRTVQRIPVQRPAHAHQ